MVVADAPVEMVSLVEMASAALRQFPPRVAAFRGERQNSRGSRHGQRGALVGQNALSYGGVFDGGRWSLDETGDRTSVLLDVCCGKHSTAGRHGPDTGHQYGELLILVSFSESSQFHNRESL